MGFPRQEHRNGLPLPPPGDLPDRRTEPMSFALAGGLFTTEPPGKPKEILLGTVYFAVDFSFPFFFKLGGKKGSRGIINLVVTTHLPNVQEY